MNEQKQIEAAARLDGWKLEDEDRAVWRHAEEGGFACVGSSNYPLPDYLHDHNAIQRLVDGMDKPKLIDYEDNHLFELIGEHVTKATCAQKLEAVLKAYGKWKKGK